MFWRLGFPAVTVVLLLVIVGLTLVGKQTLLRNTDGRLVTDVTDASAPGYRVVTDPTPTMLVVQTDPDGVPYALTVMSLTGKGAGALIFVPMGTGANIPGAGPVTMSRAAQQSGTAGLQTAVEQVLGAGMSESVVVSPSQWTDLVAGVGAITIENPDDVTVSTSDGSRQVVFPRGTVSLQPSDVATYLRTANPGESDLNLLVRQQVFWNAWLRQVGASDDPAVLPGETSSGLGRFVRELSQDRVEMQPLPVQSLRVPGSDVVLYVPVADQVQSLVAKVIPFPLGAPPGSRPRVRLLDGVGTLDHGVAAAPIVVEGGGQIDQVGNADAFGVEQTTVYYSGQQWRDDAERLQVALGAGQVVEDPAGGTLADVTIVLGADYVPRTIRTVSTAPVGTATTTIVGVNGG